MSASFERYQKRKLISSYFSVTLSIALVLFLLGALGVLVLNTKKLADYFKEQLVVSVFLEDQAKPVEVQQLQKSITLAPYTKTLRYISKEDAAKSHSQAIGEDFMSFLGYNPLKNAIDVTLNASYVSLDKLQTIERQLMQNDFVAEVSYDKPLIAMVTKNVKRIGLWILFTSFVFTIIAVLLINSSIRLSVYSKRFIIKTMQMVGATKLFIQRPFIAKNIQLGVIGAFLACLALLGLVFYVHNLFPQLGLKQELGVMVFLFSAIFVIGIAISGVSTFFATQRFLNLRTEDDLYY